MSYEILFSELKLAIQRTNSDDMKKWALNSTLRFPAIGVRRLANFGILAKSIVYSVSEEVKDITFAIIKKRFISHIKDRAIAVRESGVKFISCATKTVNGLKKNILDNPKKNASGILALGLGFIMGSGGLDGNGGIPDADIDLFGVGEHRSILTHSIIAGIIFEGSILALADFADIICNKLSKEERSEFWDKLKEMKDEVANKLAQGASAGIAYHLGIDATLQPAPYKDLPFSMPMEAHQSLFALNAAIEGNDAISQVKKTGETIKETASTLFGKIVVRVSRSK
ncbi:MAG: hypothetical protein LBQ18_06750 [Campylobacteraceae bacterium]|jgi:hypothetical protein|nr:hypothetical protein [Campylobacteraceae bacterium]